MASNVSKIRDVEKLANFEILCLNRIKAKPKVYYDPNPQIFVIAALLNIGIKG